MGGPPVRMNSVTHTGVRPTIPWTACHSKGGAQAHATVHIPRPAHVRVRPRFRYPPGAIAAGWRRATAAPGPYAIPQDRACGRCGHPAGHVLRTPRRCRGRARLRPRPRTEGSVDGGGGAGGLLLVDRFGAVLSVQTVGLGMGRAPSADAQHDQATHHEQSGSRATQLSGEVVGAASVRQMAGALLLVAGFLRPVRPGPAPAVPAVPAVPARILAPTARRTGRTTRAGHPLSARETTRAGCSGRSGRSPRAGLSLSTGLSWLPLRALFPSRTLFPGSTLRTGRTHWSEDAGLCDHVAVERHHAGACERPAGDPGSVARRVVRGRHGGERRR